MKILVIGGGGREHALCWKIAQSKRVTKIFCAPGNAGISRVAKNVSISASDIAGLAAFAEKEAIDLTVVGPEYPLVDGIVDEFERRGLSIFGPSKRAAALEGSKSFAKKFLTKCNIPTANYAVFSEAALARTYLKDQKFPLVIKVDGLAAGKGVMICKTRSDAESAVDAILKKKEFGSAGESIVIEEFLEGEEASFIVMSDGENVIPLASTQDHKAVYDADHGPNTGGMGAYSPVPIITKELEQKILNEIMIPTVLGLQNEGRKFVGFLYAGLMICDGKPYVLEYNVRCGDPETQPLMMRLDTDIIDLFEAAMNGDLARAVINWDSKAVVCVVMASRGYPGNYERGIVIKGIEDVDAMQDVVVFHAGTKKENDKWFTNGGRVLGVTAKAEGIKNAIDLVYRATEKIHWDGVHYRKDIGHKALKYETEGQIEIWHDK